MGPSLLTPRQNGLSSSDLWRPLAFPPRNLIFPICTKERFLKEDGLVTSSWMTSPEEPMPLERGRATATGSRSIAQCGQGRAGGLPVNFSLRPPPC